MDEHNNCLEVNYKIAEWAIRLYMNLFIATILTLIIASFNILHRCITKEDNDMLFSLPTLKELQDCLMSIGIDSDPRPD